MTLSKLSFRRWKSIRGCRVRESSVRVRRTRVESCVGGFSDCLGSLPEKNLGISRSDDLIVWIETLREVSFPSGGHGLKRTDWRGG